jgi:hypothetical protein
MPTELPEEHQLFRFNDDWLVFRYDCTESGYQAICDQVPGTRSCDFVAVLRDTWACFIEVKDFRGYSAQNRRRITDGELAIEVAQKARDTLAGVISGVRRADSTYPWRALLQKKIDASDSGLRVYLWIEDDVATGSPRRWQQRLDTLQKDLKRRLHWLRPRVIVASPQTCPGSISGVTVRNLAGAAGTGR